MSVLRLVIGKAPDLNGRHIASRIFLAFALFWAPVVVGAFAWGALFDRPGKDVTGVAIFGPIPIYMALGYIAMIFLTWPPKAQTIHVRGCGCRTAYDGVGFYMESQDERCVTLEDPIRLRRPWAWLVKKSVKLVSIPVHHLRT